MKHKKLKYNGSEGHKRAILHMIGQSEEVFISKPTTSEIAAWMNVSKPTARNHLKRLADSGKLIMSEEKYRTNAIIHRWSLSHDEKANYEREMLRNDYLLYASRVLKVIAL